MDTGESWTVDFKLFFTSEFYELIIAVRKEKFCLYTMLSESFCDSETPKLWPTYSWVDHGIENTHWLQVSEVFQLFGVNRFQFLTQSDR